MDNQARQRGFASSMMLTVFGIVSFFFRAWTRSGLAGVREMAEAVIDFLEKRSKDGVAMCRPDADGGDFGNGSHNGDVDATTSTSDAVLGDVFVDFNSDEMAKLVLSHLLMFIAERITVCKKIALHPWGENHNTNADGYYAVAEGWFNGIYACWSDCREAVVLYPTARYMGFGLTVKEKARARSFVVGWGRNFKPKGGFKICY